MSIDKNKFNKILARQNQKSIKRSVTMIVVFFCSRDLGMVYIHKQKNVIYLINGPKDKNRMIISVDLGKGDKI